MKSPSDCQSLSCDWRNNMLFSAVSTSEIYAIVINENPASIKQVIVSARGIWVISDLVLIRSQTSIFFFSSLHLLPTQFDGCAHKTSLFAASSMESSSTFFYGLSLETAPRNCTSKALYAMISSHLSRLSYNSWLGGDTFPCILIIKTYFK